MAEKSNIRTFPSFFCQIYISSSSSSSPSSCTTSYHHHHHQKTNESIRCCCCCCCEKERETEQQPFFLLLAHRDGNQLGGSSFLFFLNDMSCCLARQLQLKTQDSQNGTNVNNRVPRPFPSSRVQFGLTLLLIACRPDGVNGGR